MRGKERTRPTVDLNFIFFNIRTVREPKARRSWQRRARIVLALIDWLTAAERHEIMCVWSKPDCDHYDSPALRKLLARLSGKAAALRADWEYKRATSATRAGFDADGKKRTRTKKPEIIRLFGIDYGPAANEPWPEPLQLPLIG